MSGLCPNMEVETKEGMENSFNDVQLEHYLDWSDVKADLVQFQTVQKRMWQMEGQGEGRREREGHERGVSRWPVEHVGGDTRQD